LLSWHSYWPQTSSILSAMESPSSLELFLLTLLSQQPRTAFQVHSETGISIGSCLPALKRMADRGWLKAANPASRKQVAYSVPSAGQKVLSRWKALVDEYISAPSEDAESAIRLSIVA